MDPAVAGGWATALRAACRDLSPLRGRRIAIDLANGAAAPHVATLTAWLPCDVVWIGTRGEVNAGCGSEHLEHLRAAVLEHRCDAGFAVDGDADRCRLVDELGNEVPGDALTWLLARQLDVTRLAVTVMSNGALEGLLPGVRMFRTPVGDRHLREVMDRESVPLGAEESGHVLFADHPGGDGLLTGVRTLVAAFSRAKTVSGAVSPFVPLPRRQAKLTVRHRPPLETVQELEAARLAGERALGAGGRVFLRYSGTEDVLRLLVEGEPEAEVERVMGTVSEVARRTLAS